MTGNEPKTMTVSLKYTINTHLNYLACTYLWSPSVDQHNNII